MPLKVRRLVVTLVPVLLLMTSAALAQTQPRDPRPDAPRAASPREEALKRLTAADPSNVTQWLELARLQEARGAYDDAEQSLNAALTASGRSREMLTTASGFHNRLGHFDKVMALLEEAAMKEAGDPQGHQLVAVYYYDKAAKDDRLDAADRLRYVDSGIAAADRAIALKAEYVDALVYKGLLLRVKAKFETDPVRREALIADATALQARAIELNKARSAAPDANSFGGLQPVRVGGNIKAPTKIHDVKPNYPLEALNGRISGVVILEAIIAPDGSVHSARVLRSVPMLDTAALDAVKGWRYEPTWLNGVAVPVIMTVTVNFTVQ